MSTFLLGPGIGLVALVSAVLALGLSQIDREISFYDEGIYLTNAKALASGHGYRNLSLPDAPRQGAYTPFLPLLVSSLWRLFPEFPDNLLPVRFVMLLVALAFLAVTCAYLRGVLAMGGVESVATVALVGLNPLFIFLVTLVMTDLLYALLSVLALYSYERSLARDGAGSFALAIAAALLAFLTRTIGVLLVAALVLNLLGRREVRRAIVLVVTAGVIVAAWFAWSQEARSLYAHYPEDVRANYVGYLPAVFLSEWVPRLPAVLGENLGRLLSIWTSLVAPWGPGLPGALALAVAGYGLLRSFVRGPRAQDVYCALYLLVILGVPYHDTARYAFGVSPFLLSYLFTGLGHLLSRGLTRLGVGGQSQNAARVAIALLVLAGLAHVIGVGLPNYQRWRHGTAPIQTEFHRMLDWVEDHTPADAILIGDYDQVYYLFTGRRAIRLSASFDLKIYYAAGAPREFPQAGALLEGFKRLKACYLIRDPMIGGPERLYYDDLIQALMRVAPGSLTPIYAGADGAFVVYRITGCPAGPA
jgi:hypothetical protein